MNSNNPFDYIGANDLSEKAVLDYYIEDFNYSRFLQTSRNILLVGDRGCGKSMALRYSSYPIQKLRSERLGEDTHLDLVGIYVPCNTPLGYKRESELLDEFRNAVISEHLFVLAIAFGIAKTLGGVSNIFTDEEVNRIRGEIEYLFDATLPPGDSVFSSLMQLIERESGNAQRVINSRSTTDVFYEKTFSLSSLIVPLLRLLQSTKKLTKTHFSFNIDDAHDLNTHQRKSLFSWVAYRDHSLFSFKVAIANVSHSSLETASGGAILEGHDYTRLDMVQPYQNEEADFGKLARLIIKRRLDAFDISTEPEDFFPVSQQMQGQLQASEEAVRKEAVEKYGDDSKRVSDYVYKYKRAHYFRSRSPKANRPEYSGFDTLTFISTGVIRNLLLPCYWMYDKALSLSEIDSKSVAGRGALGDSSPPAEIPPRIQSEIILARSSRLWQWLQNDMAQVIVGCSGEEAKRAYQLLDNLAVLFRERLLRHKSEPRANSFTISDRKSPGMNSLEKLLVILVDAQLLYVRSGAAKDKGKRENYYVPNRMLWPDRGLDPHGQHARVSLPATALLAAAKDNRPFPFVEEDLMNEAQTRLFDDV